mgnify:FL=1
MVNYSMRTAPEQFSCHYEDPSCLTRLESAVYCFLAQMDPQFEREIVYLCVGTDRATGDCLGPLVGTRLHTLIPVLNLFGTLEKPSHAVNLPDVLEEIAHLYKNPLVVAIDASLGNAHRIGYITIKPGGLKPGTALNKVLPIVGEFHISAVVNVGGYLEQMVLQNTRLYVVYRMAQLIADGLYQAHLRHEQDRNYCLTPASVY